VRPLRNVNIDPSYAEVIEEQDQKIKHLQQQLGKPFGHQEKFYPINGVTGGKIEIVCVK